MHAHGCHTQECNFGKLCCISFSMLCSCSGWCVWFVGMGNMQSLNCFLPSFLPSFLPWLFPRFDGSDDFFFLIAVFRFDRADSNAVSVVALVSNKIEVLFKFCFYKFIFLSIIKIFANKIHSNI